MSTPFKFSAHPQGLSTFAELTQLVETQEPAHWVATFDALGDQSGVHRCASSAEAVLLAEALMANGQACFVFAGRYMPGVVPLSPLWALSGMAAAPCVEMFNGTRPAVEDLDDLRQQLAQEIADAVPTALPVSEDVASGASELPAADLGDPDFGADLFDDEVESAEVAAVSATGPADADDWAEFQDVEEDPPEDPPPDEDDDFADIPDDFEN